MKTVTRIILRFSLLLGIFLLYNGCGNEEEVIDCKEASEAIDLAKKIHAADPTVSNCQQVITMYNKYIDNGDCDDAESYINLRDAFQKKNCP